jgi:hypothetical protein
VVHFAKGEQPPVKGFWSQTMYHTEAFFVANPLDRVNLSQRNKLNFNDEGSLDLYARKTHPARARKPTDCPPGRLWAFHATLLAEREGPLNPGPVLDAAPGASREAASGRPGNLKRLSESLGGRLSGKLSSVIPPPLTQNRHNRPSYLILNSFA